MMKPDNKRDVDYMEELVKEIKELHAHIHPPVPNPAPLGLFGFGLTTALLQIKHTRLGGDDPIDLDGVEVFCLGFAMFFGGLLQIVAGLSEIRRNNIFGYTAFMVYGGFWMSMGTIDIVQLLAAGNDIASPNPKAVQAMLCFGGIITVIFWICTFKLNKTLNLLFFLLSSTFFLLAGGVQDELVDKIGGWVGIATSGVAYWLAAAELFNDIIGEGKREIIPLGHWKANGFRHGGMQVQGRIQPEHRRQSFFSRDMFSRRRVSAAPPVVEPIDEEAPPA